MTLAQAIHEILQRSDEAFIDVSEDRARRCFYLALTNTLRSNKFSDTDAFGFVHEREHTFGVGVHEMQISDIEDNDHILILRNDPRFDPDVDNEDTFITKATQTERRNWSIAGLQPVYDRKYYQTGDNLTFYPSNAWDNVSIYFDVVTAPLPYSAVPAANHWDDTTDLRDWMSSAFEDGIIEAAATLFRQEVIVNDG